MMGKQIGYVRVSSDEQNEARQLEGLTLDKIFIDKASGKSLERPQLKAMLEYIREDDTLTVHSMDRLARNLDDLRKIVRDLTNKQVKVHFLKECMTFTSDDNPISTLMLSLMGAFAEFERALIRERQREGIAIAKRNGVYKGRKPSISPQQAREAALLAAQGVPKAKIARDLNITRMTLHNYLKTM